MPLFLLFAGILAIVVAIKGNQNQVALQLEQDFTGSGNFVYWLGAIIAIAVIGKAANVPRASKLFIAMLIVIYVISQQGLWTQLQSGVADLTAPPASSTNDVGTDAPISTTSASGVSLFNPTSIVAGLVSSALGAFNFAPVGGGSTAVASAPVAGTPSSATGATTSGYIPPVQASIFSQGSTDASAYNSAVADAQSIYSANLPWTAPAQAQYDADSQFYTSFAANGGTGLAAPASQIPTSPGAR